MEDEIRYCLGSRLQNKDGIEPFCFVSFTSPTLKGKGISGLIMNNLEKLDKFALGGIGGLLVLSGTILPLEAANTPNFSKYFSSIHRDNYSNYLALSWNEIWARIKRKKVAGGSRNGNLCLVSPSQLTDIDSQAKSIPEIWHQNPLFVWQSGKLEAVSLREENEVYWQQEVEATQTNLFYNGKPLQPGKTYKLVVFNPYETEIQNLQIVSPDRHQKIAAHLTEMENQLKAEGADREKIAFKKADYFAQLQMWSDVLWELYSIPNPSDELKATLEQLNTHNFCS